jgi:hypothetical protein
MKNQPQEYDTIFKTPEISAAFNLATQRWTTSKGNPITPEQRDLLVKKYVEKEQQGEYLTKLEEKGLIRTGAVAKACITMTNKGRHFVLIRPPSATHLRNWKLVGGKQSSEDRLSPSSEVYAALAHEVDENNASQVDVIVPLLLTTLRELNEELPFSAHIHLSSGKVVTFIDEEAKLVSIEQLPKEHRFVRINPQDCELHQNRNPEEEGKERYPGIIRDSTLMFTHAELIDPYGSTPVGEAIELNDDSGTCRWLPLTPSVLHWLAKAPLQILPENLLTRALSIPSGPIANLHAYHVNSLIESYLALNEDGATWVSLDKILEKKIQQLPYSDREDLATGTGKKSFGSVESEHRSAKKKLGPLNLAQDYRLLDSPTNGFAVVHKSELRSAAHPETIHAMHMRADQLLLFRAAGKWWKNGMLPHNTRYQQEKRTKRSTLLHEYEALYTSVRNKDIEKRLQLPGDTDKNSIKELAQRLSSQPRVDETKSETAALFALPTLQSGKVVNTPIRRFSDITLDVLNQYIDSWASLQTTAGETMDSEIVTFARSKSGNMSWQNLMMRTDASWEIMNQSPCTHCNVEAGELCHPSNMGPLIVEKRTFGDTDLPRYQPSKEHTTLALADHLLRDFVNFMGDQYALPQRDIWKKATALGILSGSVEAFDIKNLSNDFESKTGREAKPILPFSCQHRFEKACQPSVGWAEMIQGHLSPLERVAKTGKKSKGGEVRLYLSGKQTEPPFLMQNLVADVIKREYALMRSLHYKRLSLPDGRPRWNEQLLWEYITPAPNGSITTLPLDAPLEKWPSTERHLPLLHFETATYEAGSENRFYRNEKQSATRPSHRLAPQSEHWLWTRETTDRPLEGLLPIVSPDLSIGELVDIAAMNGIGVAVAIDAWSAEGLPETGERFGPADTDWYINGDLFSENEPPAYRTYGSFLGALNTNKQLNIEADQVKHERRIFGVLLLDELLNMQCNL